MTTREQILAIKEMIYQFNDCETVWGEERVIKEFLDSTLPTIIEGMDNERITNN